MIEWFIRLGFSIGICGWLSVTAADNSLLLQSTTSTQNSGLYGHLLPEFERVSGIRVNVVAVGTGQAIRNAMNCDGDVLLVHARAAEIEFVDAGFGLSRADLMYNDFVIVGPVSDPASIDDAASISEALTRIAGSGHHFISRGDDSGTHQKEMNLWQGSGLDPTSASGTWYRETGSGMGATLSVAIGMNGYTLTDRATWLNYGNKGDFTLLYAGDEALFNQYGIIAVSPTRCPSVNAAAAASFVEWVLSAEGQALIASYRINGEQLFFPNAEAGQ